MVRRLARVLRMAGAIHSYSTNLWAKGNSEFVNEPKPRLMTLEVHKVQAAVWFILRLAGHLHGVSGLNQSVWQQANGQGRPYENAPTFQLVQEIALVLAKVATSPAHKSAVRQPKSECARSSKRSLPLDACERLTSVHVQLVGVNNFRFEQQIAGNVKPAGD